LHLTWKFAGKAGGFLENRGDLPDLPFYIFR